MSGDKQDLCYLLQSERALRQLFHCSCFKIQIIELVCNAIHWSPYFKDNVIGTFKFNYKLASVTLFSSPSLTNNAASRNQFVVHLSILILKIVSRGLIKPLAVCPSIVFVHVRSLTLASFKGQCFAEVRSALFVEVEDTLVGFSSAPQHPQRKDSCGV